MDIAELRILRMKHQFLLSHQEAEIVGAALCAFQAQFSQYALHNLLI